MTIEETRAQQRKLLTQQMNPAAPTSAPAVQPTTAQGPTAQSPDFAPVSQPAPVQAPAQTAGPDQWGNAAGSQQAGIDAFWNAATNQKRNDFSDAELQGWGVNRLSGDKYGLGTGQTVDISRDFGQGGANEASWHITGGQQGQNGQGVNWGAQGGGGGAAASAPAAAPAAASTASSDWQNQIRAMLMQQMQGLSQPVSADDATIKSEMDSQSRLIDRNRQDRRAASAERMAFQGLNSGGQGSGALDQDTAAGYEDAGAAKSGVLSQLMGRELESRRSKLQNAMQLALQTGDAESARSLQMQLGLMDDQIKRASLSQQASQFSDSYGLDVAEAERRRTLDAQRQKAGLAF